MATNDFQVEDYLATARSRVTEQFKEKEVFDRYIQLLIHGSTLLQDQYKVLMQERSLDTAVGVQLDTIGTLVGLARGTLPATALEGSYFGFLDAVDALPFADLELSNEAGVFYDLGDPTSGNVRWDDNLYRMFIKAKIYANVSDGKYEDVLRAVKDIMQVSAVDIIELGNAKIQISFNKILNPVEEYILFQIGEGQSLFPIPIGVGVEYVESAEDFFGFEETPGALGFAGGVGYGEGYGVSYGGGETAGGYFASLVG